MALGGTDFKLRSDTEKATYNEFTIETTADITAGTMAKWNDVVGVYVSDTDDGDDNTFVYEASIILVPCVAIPSGSTGSYEEGDKVYFDETLAEVTADSDSGSNVLCGVIHEAGAKGDETILIHLMGALGIVD